MTMSAKTLFSSFTIASLLFCWGCGGSDGPPRSSVRGKITLDGAEIAEGTITFFPTGGTKGPTAGTTISAGRYAIAADRGPVAGRYRIEIHGPRKTGRQVPAPGPVVNAKALVDEIVETVPKRYNLQSTLEADVKPGRNELDFALTAK